MKRNDEKQQQNNTYVRNIVYGILTYSVVSEIKKRACIKQALDNLIITCEDEMAYATSNNCSYNDIYYFSFY